MNTKKPDISQIKKYLQNELDARAMHQLERKAQDDPFLAEAMEGFENSAADQEVNFADLQRRLAIRLEPAKERSIWLWRVLPLAACLLIALLVGYWYLTPKTANKQLTENLNDAKKITIPSSTKETVKSSTAVVVKPGAQILQKSRSIITAPPTQSNTIVKNGDFKPDTIDNYTAYNRQPIPNKSIDELLKKMDRIEVDSNGNVTHPGQAVAKARLNGKDYAGGDVQQALKSLPADVVKKIQTVDDYGDLAANKRADSTKTTGSRVVRGKVLSKEDGLPIPGAIIKVPGSATGTQSNANGTFSINVPANTDLLNIAYLGYETLQVKITGKDSIKAALNQNNASLAEVVVVSSTVAQKTKMTTQPQGGQKAYDDYLKKEAVMPNGETGTVSISFTVNAAGYPENITIVSSSKNKEIDDKAIRLIENGPKWIKGTDNKTIRQKIKFHK